MFNLPEDVGEPVYIPVSKLVDTYTPGDYITITDNQVSVNYDALKTRLDDDTDTLAEKLKAKIVYDSNDVVLSAKIGSLDPDTDETKPTVQDALEYLEGQITTIAAAGITNITTTKAVDETDPKLIISKDDNSTTVNIDVNVGALISNASGNIIKLNGGKLYAHMNWEVL